MGKGAPQKPRLGVKGTRKKPLWQASFLTAAQDSGAFLQTAEEEIWRKSLAE
jgi:hypothetical protein